MLDSYRLRIAALGGYEGEAKRRNSQKIMDVSWMRDPATKPVYVKWVNSGIPVIDDDDVPVYAKYNVKSYHNITGDEVAYLLQFRLEDMKERPDIKVGSYVSIPNELDEPEWWLIWHYDDRPQFRQFSIVKCTWIYKWTSFKDGHRIIHQCLGVTRNQNNYNSGCWLDYYTEVVEQQHVMLMPSNDDTNILTYNTRLLVSNVGRHPPIAWKISKVQPSVVNDTVRFTMTQEQYNAAVDNAELMIADYKKSYVEPEILETEESIPSNVGAHTIKQNLEIVYSGKPVIRAGGGFKKFILKENVDGKLVDASGDIKWSADFGGNEDKLEFLIEDNICKIKCSNDYSLIGNTFNLIVTTEYGSKSIIVEVTSL
jgi:hypothetical protein